MMRIEERIIVVHANGKFKIYSPLQYRRMKILKWITAIASVILFTGICVLTAILDDSRFKALQVTGLVEAGLSLLASVIIMASDNFKQEDEIYEC